MTTTDVKFGPENGLDGIISFKNGANLEDVVIFLHGFQADCRGSENKARVKIYCEKAPEHGFYGVTFSFSGHGNSLGKSGFVSKPQLVEDIGYAVDFVRNKLYKKMKIEGKPKTISLCGSSTGATGALFYVIENPDKVNSLILISPFTTFDNVKLPKKLRAGFKKHYETYKETKMDSKLDFQRTDEPSEAEDKDVPASTYYWLNHMNGIEAAKKINIPTLVMCGTNDGWIEVNSIKEGLYKNLNPEIRDLREYIDGHGLKGHEGEVIGDMFSFLKKIIKEKKLN